MAINDEKIANWLCSHPLGLAGVSIVVKSSVGFLSWDMLPEEPVLVIDHD